MPMRVPDPGHRPGLGRTPLTAADRQAALELLRGLRRSRRTGAKQTTGGRPATAAGRWRLKRDILLWISLKAGMPQRLVADAFDLSRSRVRSIRDKVQARIDALRAGWPAEPRAQPGTR